MRFLTNKLEGIFMETQVKEQAVRTPRSESRTKRVLSLVKRQKGASMKEIVTELNKMPGRKPLNERTARGWLAPSFLAAFGIRLETIEGAKGKVRFKGIPMQQEEAGNDKASAPAAQSHTAH